MRPELNFVIQLVAVITITFVPAKISTDILTRRLSKARETCVCMYQVKFGESESEKLYLRRDYKVFTCYEEDDVYECRLLCAFKLMDKRTYNPHAQGLAFKSDREAVNIVSEACLHQRSQMVSVDIRYKLCDDADRKFLTFKYCCQYVINKLVMDRLKNPTTHDIMMDQLRRLVEESGPNINVTEMLYHWVYSPTDSCFMH